MNVARSGWWNKLTRIDRIKISFSIDHRVFSGVAVWLPAQSRHSHRVPASKTQHRIEITAKKTVEFRRKDVFNRKHREEFGRWLLSSSTVFNGLPKGVRRLCERRQNGWIFKRPGKDVWIRHVYAYFILPPVTIALCRIFSNTAHDVINVVCLDRVNI